MRTDVASVGDTCLGVDGKRGRDEDRLLAVANFLNQFQAHFLPLRPERNSNNTSENDGEANFPGPGFSLGEITTRDLDDALEFRSLLERVQIVEEERFVAEEYGRSEAKLEPLARKLADRNTNELITLENQVKAVPDRTKLVLSILRRFEVWSSKLIAQDHLLSPKRLIPEPARSKTTQCCYSPLMNLPSSKYFADLLPPIDTDDAQQMPVVSGTDGPTPSSTTSIPAFHRKNKRIDCCSLSLPPNKHTWEAYVRLATVASLIGDDELVENDNDDGYNMPTITSKNRKELALAQCFKSPSCVYDLNKGKKGKGPSQTSHQYVFTPSSDFIPLWIRAQRNTQALRQLNFLFEMKRNEANKTSSVSNGGTILDQAGSARIGSETPPLEEESGRVNQVMASGMETDSGYTRAGACGAFTATFRGNPTYANLQTEVSEQVDRLVEWAVLNQSIFTYHHIRKQICTAPLRKHQLSCSRKRQRDTKDDSPSVKISKRVLRDENDARHVFELRQASQSYILRWFARRNRNALTILFSKHFDRLSLDIGCFMNRKALSQAEALREAGVLSNDYEYIRSLSTRSFYREDRTLSRIDRRLFIPGRYDGSTAISCQSQVLSLLEALAEVCPRNQKALKRIISAAIEDLDLLFRTFSVTSDDKGNEEDIYRTVLRLVDTSNGTTNSNLIDLLKNAPSPWKEKCGKCGTTGSSDLRACFNCEQTLHEECANSASGSAPTTIRLKDLINAFPPMKEMFKLKQPDGIERPDFSTSENDWTEKKIRVERKVTRSGHVGKLGISFADTEDCAEVFDAIENDVFSLLDVMGFEDKYSIGDQKLVPARIHQKGCLVTQVCEDLHAAKAGLQIGDIITSVVIKKFVHAQDEERYGKSKRIYLSKLSSEDRISLLQVESLKMNLNVLRPSKNVIELATTWHAAVKQKNMTCAGILRGLNELELWYCGTCSRSNTSNKSESVFQEAAHCRAVVRRLGMESYAQPFLEGNQNEESGYFCLRRLDSIMTHIMRTESNVNSNKDAPDSLSIPHPDDSTRQRLPWATEQLERSPMTLLCEAMKTLMSSSSPGKRNINIQRNALLRHFIVAFGSWCVGTTVKSSAFDRLAGPPQTFLCSRAPWLGPSCPICFSRPLGGNASCKDDMCVTFASRAGKQWVDNIDEVEIKKTKNDMKKYALHASLVGTSFLVLPSDPLVKNVSQIVHIEHEDRPVEFIVASYLPSDYRTNIVTGRQQDQYDEIDENDGIYHLLPVVSLQQQSFLLDRCKMRNKDQIAETSGALWTSLDVLNLEGVVRYSPAALKKKIDESRAMRIAIDNETIQGAYKSSTVSQMLSLDHQNLNPGELVRTESFSSTSPCYALGLHDNMIGTLLKGRAASEAIRELLNDPSDEKQIAPSEDELAFSKRKIIQPNGSYGPMEFGVSNLQPGLVPINPIKTSCQILILPNVANSEYAFFYSDFLFQDNDGRQNLMKNMYPSNLISPPSQALFGDRVPVKKRSVTLSRRDLKIADTKVVGWGFEFLRWKREKFVRIGRVHRGSLAFRVGLMTHDIVESINGVRFSCYHDLSSLVTATLGATKIKVRLPSGLDRHDQISTLVSTIAGTNIEQSPVSITIIRPLPPYKQVAQPRESTPVGRPVQPLSLQIRHNDYNVTSRKNSTSITNINRGTIREDTRKRTSQSANAPVIVTNHVGYVPCPQKGAIEGADTSKHTLGTTTNNEASGTIPISPRMNTNRGNLHHRELRFLVHVGNSFRIRPHAKKMDLYRPAKNGTILTALEVAVLLQACHERMYKFGLRLLMPRYDIQTTKLQMKIIAAWDQHIFAQIPRIERSAYQEVLDWDYKRMVRETGPVIIRERTRNETYQYREPVEVLPIDRILEKYFDVHQKRWNGQHIHPHQPRERSSLTANHHSSTHDQNTQHQSNMPVRQHRQHLQNRSDNPPQESNMSNNQNRRSHVPTPFNNGTIGDDTHLRFCDPVVVDLLDEDDEATRTTSDPPLNIDEPGIDVHSDHQQGGNENFPNQLEKDGERIRGGGDDTTDGSNGSITDEQNNYLVLCDVPGKDWKGKAVYTFVQGIHEGKADSDVLVVGFAKRFINIGYSDEDIPDRVEMETYYAAGTGYFEDTKTLELDSDEVWVVDVDGESEEAKVIAKLKSENRLPKDYYEGDQLALFRSRSSPEEQTEDESIVSENKRCSVQDPPPECEKLSSPIDTLRLGFDHVTYAYSCEDIVFRPTATAEPKKGCHDCSLCSLPFERYLSCSTAQNSINTNPKLERLSRSLGCGLMSEKTLDGQRSSLGDTIPGRLGEGKMLLLKIASYIPESLKSKNSKKSYSGHVQDEIDPLDSCRVFDSDINFTIWKTFVAECSSTRMLAQAFVALLASIERTKLPQWWSRKSEGWSTAYAIMSETNLSALYLHIYVFDAALSDMISRSLRATPRPHVGSDERNAIQQRRMTKYWDRAVELGYRLFRGKNNELCYHCSDGGDLLCCELCPNVQHYECCDPKISPDANIDHWICDSCINDIENYEEGDEDFDDHDEDDDDDDFY